MLKKAFSTAANLAKSITWTFRGTTEDVGGLGYLKAVEDAAANIPALAAKVTKGEIIGNPHPTKDHEGNVIDAHHMSGILGKGNMKQSNRATSFHYYPETGLIEFSNKAYGSYYVNPLTNAESSAAAQAATQIPAHQKGSDWVWDEHYKKYRYWDGTKWVLQEDNQ